MSDKFQNEGFTLIELMIGVTIVGILAGLAVPTFKGYVYRGRVSEAVRVLNEIKTRQEAYRGRFGNYAAVSNDGVNNQWTAATYTPAAVPGVQPVSWPSGPGWEELGLSSPGLVRFQYATVAGGPGETPPATSNLDNTNFWYAAQAVGDLDGDANEMTLEVYSESRIMYNSAVGVGGWE